MNRIVLLVKGLSALRCFASKVVEKLLYTDLRENADHKSTSVSTENFLSNARHFGIDPPLCSIEGWTAHGLLWDLMHNLYIGTGRDLTGSIIARLVELKFYSDSSDVDVHLAVLSAECRRWCLENRVGVYPPCIDHKTVGLPEDAARVPMAASPELDLKAAHVKLYMMFLASELFIATCALADYELRSLSVCMNHLFPHDSHDADGRDDVETVGGRLAYRPR